MEAYLRGCGAHRAELKKQSQMIKEFVRIANFVKDKDKSERLESLHAELNKMQWQNKVSLPLNQRYVRNILEMSKTYIYIK